VLVRLQSHAGHELPLWPTFPPAVPHYPGCFASLAYPSRDRLYSRERARSGSRDPSLDGHSALPGTAPAGISPLIVRITLSTTSRIILIFGLLDLDYLNSSSVHMRRFPDRRLIDASVRKYWGAKAGARNERGQSTIRDLSSHSAA